MMTDQKALTELHDMARKIGMKRAWFQDHSFHPHYDLTESRRKAAILLGAVEANSTEIVKKCSFFRVA